MGLISLARVNRIPKILEIRIVYIRRKNRDEARYVGLTVVSKADQRQPMLAHIEGPVTIELVLLAMLQPAEKSISVGSFKCHPRFRSGTQSGRKVYVALVASKRQKWIEMSM